MTESDFNAVATMVLGTFAGTVVLVGFAIYQLGKIAGRLDLVLRKLNNSQPDDEGGY